MMTTIVLLRPLDFIASDVMVQPSTRPFIAWICMTIDMIHTMSEPDVDLVRKQVEHLRILSRQGRNGIVVDKVTSFLETELSKNSSFLNSGLLWFFSYQQDRQLGEFVIQIFSTMTNVGKRLTVL